MRIGSSNRLGRMAMSRDLDIHDVEIVAVGFSFRGRGGRTFVVCFRFLYPIFFDFISFACVGGWG